MKMIDRLPTPTKLVISHKAEEEWNRRRTLFSEQERLNKCWTKFTNCNKNFTSKTSTKHTRLWTHLHSLENPIYIPMKARSLKSSRLQQQAKQRRGEQTDKIRIARGLSLFRFLFSFFPSVCVPSPFLSISLSMSRVGDTQQHSKAGQGFTDDEE